MADHEFDFDDIMRRMDGAASVFRTELAGLRTGRANAALLDPITVDAYGQATPLNQLATISVPEPRMISVQVWDKANAHAVERAIRESDLGLNPVVEGTLFRIPLPELNEERRKELVKVAHKYAEQARVAVRNVRRDGMDQLKKMEKAGEISQDEHHAFGQDIQELTDTHVKDIDAALEIKEKEILTV